MKLDVSVFKYLDREHFRVLTAIEMGSKNHEIVPTNMIENISSLRRGGCRKILQTLHKHKLIVHDAKKYDGFKLTYLGYDFLALRTLFARGHLADVAMRVGVGKEADIHIAFAPNGKKLALKLHRLGRISFRSIKNNRDYLQHRKNASWQYMARLAATKEFAYNKALAEAGFRVPVAIDHNRHCILMEFVDAVPFVKVSALNKPFTALERLFRLVVRLAKSGIIHGDYNEFNLMINLQDESKITVIDFPQVVTTEHLNAEYYFDRDVKCICEFFRKRFQIDVDEYPTWAEVVALKKEMEEADGAVVQSVVDKIDQSVKDNDSMLMQTIDAEANASAEKSGKKNQLAGIAEGDEDEDEDDEDDDSEEGDAFEVGENEDEEDVEGGEAEDDGEIEDFEAEMAAQLEAYTARRNAPTVTPRTDKTSLGMGVRTPQTGFKEDEDELADGLKSKLTLKDNDDSDGSGDDGPDRGQYESEVDFSDADNDDATANGGNTGTKVPQIQDQIHVLRRKKKTRRIVTAEEARDKFKKEVRNAATRNCNKTKSARANRAECKEATKDLGY